MTEQQEQYNTALAVVPPSDGMSLMQLGDVLSKSGYFQDAKGAAQAIVKVLAGRELGIGPIASMTGIHIIQGRVAVGANVMAGKVKGSARYDYRVLELTGEKCRIEFFERVGTGMLSLGVSEFTAADAKAANTKNMQAFPRNMLFARAISNGVKWYTPDLSIAPMYTPDELGATVDYETGEIITGTATDVTDKADAPQADKPAGNGGNGHSDARPWAPAALKAHIDKLIAAKSKGMKDAGELCSLEARGLLTGKMNEIWAGDADADHKRHSLLKFLIDKDSAKLITKVECNVLLGWLVTKDEDTGDYPLVPQAIQEANAVIRDVLAQAGQADMFGGEAAVK